MERPNEKICGVYALKYRDWFYIGNSVNIYLRFSQHKAAIRRGEHTCKAFQNDYFKYGGEIKLIVLKECPLEILYFEEHDYIISYRESGLSVYNKTPSQKPIMRWSNEERVIITN